MVIVVADGIAITRTSLLPTLPGSSGVATTVVRLTQACSTSTTLPGTPSPILGCMWFSPEKISQRLMATSPWLSVTGKVNASSKVEKKVKIEYGLPPLHFWRGA